MMADKLDNLLTTIAQASLQNFDLHIKQLIKTNQSQIKVLDMHTECQKALQDAFELIGRRGSYQYVINSINADQKKPAERIQENNDSEDDIDRASDEEQPTDSMATLIMGFSKLKQPKAPQLPPRSADDSIVSEELDESYRKSNYAGVSKPRAKEAPNNLSIDTDTIIRQANENLETSQGSITSGAENKIPLPKPIDRSVLLNKEFLETFRKIKNFKIYTVQCDFVAVEPRHLSAR